MMEESDFKFVLNRVARSKALPNSTFWSGAYAEDVTRLIEHVVEISGGTVGDRGFRDRGELLGRA